MRGQECRQFEFGRRQVHRLAVARGAVRDRIELDRADDERSLRGRPGVAFPSTEHCLDPRHELTWREGLGHVVVRSDAESDHDVDLCVAGSQHQAPLPVGPLRTLDCFTLALERAGLAPHDLYPRSDAALIARGAWEPGVERG